MSKLRIEDNKLIHIEGNEALEKSLHKYTLDADIDSDTPVVIITADLFERLKLYAQLTLCA